MSKRGFSLLETLIATGVLIVVVMGVMSLSNSLIVGTVVNADKTIINRWASEGIELTQKIRDDRILNKTTAPEWFGPAIIDNGRDYGWYKLEPDNTMPNTWKLSPATYHNHLAKDDFKNDAGSSLISDQTIGYRLICVEAVGAEDVSSEEDFRCNTDLNGQVVEDGERTNLTTCQTGDRYCAMTQASINQNSLTLGKIIPPGNA